MTIKRSRQHYVSPTLWVSRIGQFNLVAASGSRGLLVKVRTSDCAVDAGINRGTLLMAVPPGSDCRGAWSQTSDC